MKISRSVRIGAALCGFQVLAIGPALAGEHDAHQNGAMKHAEHHHHAMEHPKGAPPTEAAAPEQAADVKFLDLDLVDQDGQSVRFKSDVVADRLVVMDFIFTTCPSVCPVQSSIFARLQDELGDRVGKEVFLVSVSIDPKTDVPQRLKAYAARYKAGPGWTWLTGKKQNIDQILLGVGAYSRDAAEHPAMILVGDGAHGGWTRYYGFPKPSAILARIDELSAARHHHELAEAGHGGTR